jgi:ribose transport system ATP-binding protein
MLKRGFFYLPPDRRDEGLMTMRAARENMALPALSEPAFRKGPFLNLRSERSSARDLAQRLDLRPPRVERAADHFSGGNQQKIMLAKCLTREVALFVFDEPTVGVDVGTRVAIYQFVRDLCEAGAGILLISSDLPEVLNLSHRLYVFYRGQVQAELAKPEISEERVLSHFFERAAA